MMDENLVHRASSALLKYVKNTKLSQKSSLLNTPDSISVVVGLRKIPENAKLVPRRVSIPNSLYAPEEGHEMCLFVKESAKKDLKTALIQHPVPGLRKVIGLQKLRTAHQRFEDKRTLCSSYDLFLCDDRILPMMPKALGKTFYAHKKLPVPVRVSRSPETLSANIARARDSTYFYLGHGPCCNVRVARTDMTAKQITDNIVAAMEGIVEYIPKRWKNVQSVHIKTPDSAALPIFSVVPDFGLTITQPPSGSGELSRKRVRDEESEEEEGQVVEAAASPVKKARVSVVPVVEEDDEDDDDEEEVGEMEVMEEVVVATPKRAGSAKKVARKTPKTAPRPSTAAAAVTSAAGKKRVAKTPSGRVSRSSVTAAAAAGDATPKKAVVAASVGGDGKKKAATAAATTPVAAAVAVEGVKKRKASTPGPKAPVRTPRTKAAVKRAPKTSKK